MGDTSNSYHLGNTRPFILGKEQRIEEYGNPPYLPANLYAKIITFLLGSLSQAFSVKHFII